MDLTEKVNNKDLGDNRLPADLFKYDGEELIMCIHQPPIENMVG